MGGRRRRPLLDDAGAVIGTSGFYVDVTEPLQSDIATAVSEVVVALGRIEEAKGALMAAYGVSAERAFDILVWRSQETNTKVRDPAARFLAAIAGKALPDKPTHIDRALLGL